MKNLMAIAKVATIVTFCVACSQNESNTSSKLDDSAHIPNSEGIELMGPRHFGFDFDFIPIEQLQAGK